MIHTDTERIARAQRLRQLREARGFTRARLAARAGTTAGQIQKLEMGERKLSVEWAERLGAALGVAAADILNLEAPARGDDTSAPRTGDVPDFASMPRSLPVYGTALAGDHELAGDFSLNRGEALDMVRRPPSLAHVRGAYAVYVTNESMYPWRKPGQLVYVNPARPAAIGDYVVVQLRPRHEGDAPLGLLKRLDRAAAHSVVLHQFNPDKDIRLDRARILAIHRVVDWDELLEL